MRVSRICIADKLMQGIRTCLQRVDRHPLPIDHRSDSPLMIQITSHRVCKCDPSIDRSFYPVLHSDLGVIKIAIDPKTKSLVRNSFISYTVRYITMGSHVRVSSITRKLSLKKVALPLFSLPLHKICLLYTSDAADE